MKGKYVYLLFLSYMIFFIPILSFADDTNILDSSNSKVITAESGGQLSSVVQPGSKEPEPFKPEERPPSEEESLFHIGLDVTVTSKYIWQGLDYSNGKPVIQPEVSLSYKDLSAIAWFNYDIDTKELNEIDIYLQYSKSLGNFDLTGGYAHFDYPHRDGWDPSQEVTLDVSYPTLLNPSVSIHYDFDAGDGAYYVLGMGHDFETKIGALSLASQLHYHDNYYEASGFPSLELRVSDAYTAGSITITPSISYFVTWDNGDYVDLANNVVYSINIAWGF